MALRARVLATTATAVTTTTWDNDTTVVVVVAATSSTSTSSTSLSYTTNHNVDTIPIDTSCREQMCEWTFRICNHFHIPRYLVGVAFNFLDRFLHVISASCCDRRSFKLASMTSLYIATKIFSPITNNNNNNNNNNSHNNNNHNHHSYEPLLSINTLAELSRGEFEIQHIAQMELLMLELLEWKVHPPVVQDYVHYLLTYLLSSQYNHCCLEKIQWRTIVQRTMFFAELTVYDYDLILHDRAILALACIFNAMEAVLLMDMRHCHHHGHHRHHVHHHRPQAEEEDNRQEAYSLIVQEMELLLLGTVQSHYPSFPTTWSSSFPHQQQQQQEQQQQQAPPSPQGHQSRQREQLETWVRRTQRRLWYLFSCSAQSIQEPSLSNAMLLLLQQKQEQKQKQKHDPKQQQQQPQQHQYVLRRSKSCEYLCSNNEIPIGTSQWQDQQHSRSTPKSPTSVLLEHSSSLNRPPQYYLHHHHRHNNNTSTQKDETITNNNNNNNNDDDDDNNNNDDFEDVVASWQHSVSTIPHDESVEVVYRTRRQ